MLQTKSHVSLAQVATEFRGAVQGVQLVPQLAMSPLLLHASPQRCCPATQVKSQRFPMQAGKALGMPSQLAHEGPQAAMLLSASQLMPQA